MFYSIVRGIIRIILLVFYRVKIHGFDNIPNDGRLILCSNHMSNWDPIFISIVFPRQISWMGKKELFQNKLLAFLLSKLNVFPIDRDGSDFAAMKKALRLLKDEKVLGLFPEGTRVEKFDPNNAKSGVALISYKSKSPILPVYIESNYKLFNKVNIVIGEPIDLIEKLDGKPRSDDYLKISKEILAKIYGFKTIIGGLDEDYTS